MSCNHNKYKSFFGVFIALLVVVVSMFLNSCAKNRNVSIECVSNYILTNIDKEKIKNFIKLEGINVWREGWGYLTSEIAEDYFVIEECGVEQYLAQFNLSLNDLKGRMIFVYSIHSYLKDGNINKEVINQKVDYLYLKEKMGFKE